MPKFSIGALLNDQSQSLATQDTFDITNIRYEDLIPNKLNNYELSALEELAASIEAYGLKQNLEVKAAPDQPGKYVILTGHRRHAAIGMIRKDRPDLFSHVPCRIVDVASTADEKIQMIITNATARDMSDADKLNQYIDLKKAIEERIKETGEKIGDKRKYFATMLKVSETQIQRYRDVEEKLIPELKSKIQDGDLSIQKAAEIAKLPQETQETIKESLEKEKKEPTGTKVISISSLSQKPSAETERSTAKGPVNSPTEPIVPVERSEFNTLTKYVNHLKTIYIASNSIEVPADKKVTIDAKLKQIEKAFAQIYKLMGTPLN